MSQFDMKQVQWEHAFRAVIRQVRNHVAQATRAGYVTVRFEQSSDDGKWSVNSWGGGTSDITTRGAVLQHVMAEHVRRVNIEGGLDTLPALLGTDVPADVSVEEPAPAHDDNEPL